MMLVVAARFHQGTQFPEYGVKLRVRHIGGQDVGDRITLKRMKGPFPAGAGAAGCEGGTLEI